MPKELTYQSEFEDLVLGHYSFLTRDPRFKRKLRQNKTIGIVMIVCFGIAMAYSGANPMLIGTMLALISGLFVWDSDYLAPKRLRRKLDRHLRATKKFSSETIHYQWQSQGLMDGKGQLHTWNSLREIDQGKDYLGLVFEDLYLYLPARALGPVGVQTWLNECLHYAPHTPVHICK